MTSISYGVKTEVIIRQSGLLISIRMTNIIWKITGAQYIITMVFSADRRSGDGSTECLCIIKMTS
jgi:hypothetical protein